MEDSVAVDDDDLACAGREQELGCRGPAGATAGYDDVRVFQAFADEVERVGERGENGDGRRVLVGVEHSDLGAFAEERIDCEAARSADPLEMNSREVRCERGDRVDECLDTLAIDDEGNGVEIGEALVDRGGSLDDRQCRLRAEIPQGCDAGPIADHRDRGTLAGEARHARRVCIDQARDALRTRRGDDRQCVEILHSKFRRRLQGAPAVRLQDAVVAVTQRATEMRFEDLPRVAEYGFSRGLDGPLV